MESSTCAEEVRLALAQVAGVMEVQVCHISGKASVKHKDVEIEIISETLGNHGFSISILKLFAIYLHLHELIIFVTALAV